MESSSKLFSTPLPAASPMLSDAARSTWPRLSSVISVFKMYSEAPSLMEVLAYSKSSWLVSTTV
ncbi:MAG: hypothetical protein ACLTC4_20280 [Hungatella hathewayi]